MTKSNIFQKMKASFLFAVSAFSASIAMDTSPELCSEDQAATGIACLPENARFLIYSECRVKDLHTLSLTSKGMKKDITKASQKNQRIQAVVDDIIICNPNKDNFPLKNFISEVGDALGLFSGVALMCEADNNNPYNDVEFEDLLSVVNNPQITKLSLVHMNISQEALENILCSIQRVRHLKSLFLAHQGLSDKMATHLSKNKHLTYLGLSDYYHGDNVEGIVRQSPHIKRFDWIESEAFLLYNYKSLDEKTPMTKFLNLVNIITSLKNDTFAGTPQEHNEAMSLLRKSSLSTSLIPKHLKHAFQTGREGAKTSAKKLVRKLTYPSKQIFMRSMIGTHSIQLDQETKWSDIYNNFKEDDLLSNVGFDFIYGARKIRIGSKDLPVETFYDIPNEGTVQCIPHLRGD